MDDEQPANAEPPLDGILVAGLAISMHRDASAMVRMQKDMHNQGYAAGMAAAISEVECQSSNILSTNNMIDRLPVDTTNGKAMATFKGMAIGAMTWK